MLAPPSKDTGNGVFAGQCTPGTPNSTTTEYEEGVDIDQTQLNGGGPYSLLDGGFKSIDPARLPRDPFSNCQPVYPWNFMRTNTIYGVIHAAGGYTAWSDKHAVYASVSGPTGWSLIDKKFEKLLFPVPTTAADLKGIAQQFDKFYGSNHSLSKLNPDNLNTGASLPAINLTKKGTPLLSNEAFRRGEHFTSSFQLRRCGDGRCDHCTNGRGQNALRFGQERIRPDSKRRLAFRVSGTLGGGDLYSLRNVYKL